MKVLEGSFFQKGPPPLVLRYSNLLSEIRELFATWAPSKYMNRTIWTYEPLHTYCHLLVESHHSNIRKTLLWLFTTLLCWFRTNKYLLGKCYLFFIALIKQAHIVHRILYSFCETCNITKRKRIRKYWVLFIVTQVDLDGMLLAVHQCFQLTCLTCLIEVM